MVFVFQKVFTNTIFYQILVFGDTNACLLPHRACCNRQRHIRRLHIVHPHTPDEECEKEDDSMDATYHVCEIISQFALQRYCFFLNCASKLTKKTLLEVFVAVLERCLAGNLLEDAVESLVGRETA